MPKTMDGVIASTHGHQVTASTQDNPGTVVASFESSNLDESSADTEMFDIDSSFDDGRLGTNSNDSNSSFSINDDDVPFEEMNGLDIFGDNDSDGSEPTTDHHTQHDTPTVPHEDQTLHTANVVLNNITRLLEHEFSKNPLSTQQILVREAATIYQQYGEHGSSLRLSESVLNFLKRGDTVIRPASKLPDTGYTFSAPNEGGNLRDERHENKPSAPGCEIATLKFAPFPEANDAPWTQDDEPEPELVSWENGTTSLHSTPLHQHTSNQNLQAHNLQPEQQTISSSTDRDDQQQHLSSHPYPLQIKSIRQLLPAQFMANHDHPYTMTNDPETHALFDPNHPDQTPFRPIDITFSMAKIAGLPPGALETLNKIFQLIHLHATHQLDHLTTKYSPMPTVARPNPPAPPLALFRLGIQHHVRAGLADIFTTVHQDPLGLTPQVRVLLKDLFDNHQRGRMGLTSLDAYHGAPEDLRSDSWLLGREHVDSVALNHIEVGILARATGVLAESCEIWWDERAIDLRGWGLLRCWIRAQEVQKVMLAKQYGHF